MFWSCLAAVEQRRGEQSALQPIAATINSRAALSLMAARSAGPGGRIDEHGQSRREIK